VNPRIVVQLRVECVGGLISIADADDFAVYDSEGFHAVRSVHDIGRADEGHRDGSDSGHAALGVEASELSAVCVSLYADRERRKMPGRVILQFFCQKNQTGTGGENRKPILNPLPKRQKHFELVEQLSLNGAFAAGKDNSVKIFFKICCISQFNAGDAEALQHFFMFDKGSLKSQHSDSHRNSSFLDGNTGMVAWHSSHIRGDDGIAAAPFTFRVPPSGG